MGIKTEDMYKNLPPKVITEGVDWLGILDAFDPTKLEDRFINECARRNPYDTSYKSEPPMPVEERLKHSQYGVDMDRKDLETWASRIGEEGLNHSLYSNARRVLIKAIGSKGAQSITKESMSGWAKPEENYRPRLTGNGSRIGRKHEGLKSRNVWRIWKPERIF